MLMMQGLVAGREYLTRKQNHLEMRCTSMASRIGSHPENRSKNQEDLRKLFD
jgi:hypothetical protein